MNNKTISVLIVDDDEAIRDILFSTLRNTYACATASSAAEALSLLSGMSFNLVISDIAMPGASGLELCKIVHEKSPDTVVIMVSGLTDIEYAINAMQRGAFDYVVKPFDLVQIAMVVERALQHQSLLAFRRHYEESLEETVRTRTNELRLLNDSLNQMLEVLYSNYRSTLRSLAQALEARDVETRGHSDRVVAYCLRIGKEMGLTQREMIGLEQGALLHDIGKIGVRDSILLKKGPLSPAEWVEMREHINHGMQIIQGIDFLSGAKPVVGQHHEKYDGSGYPLGLSGDAIHIHARIFAVADAFDAITSDRPYRAARSYRQARQEIVINSGAHFDPDAVDAFLRIPEAELMDIRSRADGQDYSMQIIGEREIRSFIISLKRNEMAGRTGTTGMLQELPC
ncbi:MAG: response regulator [Acidobacteria bacterium]|nr:response regulator [Acidobacteriota bacterium]